MPNKTKELIEKKERIIRNKRWETVRKSENRERTISLARMRILAEHIPI